MFSLVDVLTAAISNNLMRQVTKMSAIRAHDVHRIVENRSVSKNARVVAQMLQCPQRNADFAITNSLPKVY
jgi:hypothetical protein